MFKCGPELCPPPVDAAADGAQLDPERGGDLLVRQALDVAENDRGPVLGGQCLERRLDVIIEVAVVECLGGSGSLPPSRAAVSSASPSNLIRCFRRAMSRKRFVVIRCSQPSNVPGV
jgi:hypothetical protein